jgi:hypothetical protein
VNNVVVMLHSHIGLTSHRAPAQVGVWDFDELLVPRQPGLDIPQIIKKEADPVKNKDKDKCFLVFDSFRHDLVSNHTRSMWLGERYVLARTLRLGALLEPHHAKTVAV